VDDSSVPLRWCFACQSYTQDPIAHDCDDTVNRRRHLSMMGSRWDVKAAARRDYDAYVLECRRERKARAA
jgi:hypothetical protein